MHIAYEADREADLTENPKANADGKMNAKLEAEADCYLGVPVVITKKDGSKLDLTDSGGSIGSGKGKTPCTKGEGFQEIIPLEEMKAL